MIAGGSGEDVVGRGGGCCGSCVSNFNGVLRGDVARGAKKARHNERWTMARNRSRPEKEQYTDGGRAGDGARGGGTRPPKISVG